MSSQDQRNPKGRKSLPWRQDREILVRMATVEGLVLDGRNNVQIAEALGIAEATVRNDRRRLQELWLEQAGGEVKSRRLARIAQLEDIYERALKAADFDERMERAVLLDEPAGTRRCPGNVSHFGGQPCEGPHEIELRVRYPDKGTAQFRGAKAASLQTARQALMDAAKIEGLVVDKVAPTDDMGVPIPLESLMERYARAAGRQD